VERLFDNTNLRINVGSLSTEVIDSFKEGPQIERFGAFLCQKVKRSNLSLRLSLKGLMGVPCEKSIEGQGAFTTGCPAFSPPRQSHFLAQQ
jgi:hypothetical protein